jgi:hypothetical protein
MMAATRDQMLDFNLVIEEIVYMKDVSYMDAIIEYCDEHDVEIEVAASLISNNLKSKLQLEAEELNFLPRSNTTKLPL